MSENQGHSHQTRSQGDCENISLNSELEKQKQKLVSDKKPSVTFAPRDRSSSAPYNLDATLTLNISESDAKLLESHIFGKSGQTVRSPIKSQSCASLENTNEKSEIVTTEVDKIEESLLHLEGNDEVFVNDTTSNNSDVIGITTVVNNSIDVSNTVIDNPDYSTERNVSSSSQTDRNTVENLKTYDNKDSLKGSNHTSFVVGSSNSYTWDSYLEFDTSRK